MALVFSLLANTAVLKTFVHVFVYSFKYFLSQFSKSRIAATKGLKFYNIYRDWYFSLPENFIFNHLGEFYFIQTFNIFPR